MNFWTASVKVGVMVLIAIILLTVLLINAENWPWAAAGDELTFQFRSVNGLYVGAGVYLSGVSIGKVTAIELRPDTNDVHIRAKVKNGFKWLREDCGARISMNGFVGEVYIALDNGPIGYPPLKPANLPIVGKDPVNALELLEQTSAGMTQAIELTTAANEVLQANQEAIQLAIKEIRQVVALTGKTIEKLSVDSGETVKTLTQLALENDKRFQETLVKVNNLITQLEGDSLMVSSHVSDITREILRLLNQNSPKLNTIFTDVRATTSEFRQIAQDFRSDFSTLANQVSTLVSQGSDAIKTGEANIAPILENLQKTTDAINTLETNFSHLLTTLNKGEGTFAQLLNSPKPLQEVRGTLRNLNETMNAVTELSQRTNERIGRFESPLQFGWDYELRYLSLEERLYNELAFVLSPQSKAHYRIGVGVRDETVRFEVQYAHDLTDYLRTRAGFMRSRVGVGVDFWLWSRRLGLSVEGVGLTSREPELNTEVSLRFFRYGQLLLGAENLTDADGRRWTTGFRFFNSEW
ncbi:MAG: MlaD family protein [Candidatus Poribacteria bacterium]|nr:MlaD family protein [Candidatus Poribacteria bacterium]